MIAALQSFTPTWLVTIGSVDINAYTATWAAAMSLIVTVVLTLVFRAVGKASDTREDPGRLRRARRDRSAGTRSGSADRLTS